MFFDIKLAKDDSNNSIVEPIKLNNEEEWYKFKEDDRSLKQHEELIRLPKSKKDFKDKRIIKNKLIRSEISNKYFDHTLRRFRYNNYYLNQDLENNSNQVLKDAKLDEENALIKLNKIKFDPNYQSTEYFLYNFKQMVVGFDDELKKSEMKKFIQKMI
jgi:hypothetical protein